MNNSIGTSYIKNKFATLLSKMVTDAKLGYNEISDKLIENDFLDSFENNDISDIYEKSYEAIIYDLFKKECSYSQGLDPVIYWCGEQYINLFLNKRIPLKQLFLICPLKQMEGFYEIYHQQSELKFIEMFMKSIYTTSILKKLRKKRGYSARELAILTSISINTIKYYENNDNLFKASFENIKKIISVLDYSDSIVKQKTSYVPAFISLLNIEEIKTNFDKYICYFYNTQTSIEYIDGYFWLSNSKKIKVDSIVIDEAFIYAVENYKDNKLLF